MYDFAAITVSFNESLYSVGESDGSLQLVIVLNASSSSDIIVYVFNTDDSAYGEILNYWCQLQLCSSRLYSSSSHGSSCSNSLSPELDLWDSAMDCEPLSKN